VARPRRIFTGFRVHIGGIVRVNFLPQQSDDGPRAVAGATLIVHLVAHAATRAMRRGAFPDDDPLDARGLADAAALRACWTPPADARAFSSPARCARQTAEALGLCAAPEAGLADLDYGGWRGAALAALARTAQPALHAWLTDPRARPHGGESFVAARRRVGGWLEGLPAGGPVVAVTHPALVRAALAHALGVAPDAPFGAEVAPLTVTVLARSARGWRTRDASDG
jgi:broad specificity phosphatase PhoE